ncbi:MAG: hypothetical protein LC774_12370, partial [Acidobacteria bacterium]|nr:hypothetical protein [Acidobacteriota bacterium]
YSILAGGAGSRPGVRRFSLLYADAERIARAEDFAELLEVFESRLRFDIALNTPRRVFVHAGAVGWRGRAIVIPGRTFTGKSTLVAELVRLGATYYSDEYAVLDARGRVHPFAKQLSLREPETHRQIDTAPARLGGKVGVKPLPVGAVVLTEYREGASWRPRRLSPGRGALSMFDHTVSAMRRPELAFEALGRATATAPVLKGSRGDARATAEAILQSLTG